MLSATPTGELPIGLHPQQIDESNDVKKWTRSESFVAENSNSPRISLGVSPIPLPQEVTVIPQCIAEFELKISRMDRSMGPEREQFYSAKNLF
jgi:hypothetical protein